MRNDAALPPSSSARTPTLLCAAQPQSAALRRLALVDRVEDERDHPPPRGLHAAALVGDRRLAVQGMAARHGDARTLPRELRRVRQEEMRRHVEAGTALEEDLLDRVAVTLDAAGHARVERRPLGEAAEGLHECGAHRALPRPHGLRRRAGEPVRIGLAVGLVDALRRVLAHGRVPGRQQRGRQQKCRQRHLLRSFLVLVPVLCPCAIPNPEPSRTVVGGGHGLSRALPHIIPKDTKRPVQDKACPRQRTKV